MTASVKGAWHSGVAQVSQQAARRQVGARAGAVCTGSDQRRGTGRHIQ